MGQEQSARRAAASRGKSHGALVSAGIAAAQVNKAAALVKKWSVSKAQDVARTAFSTFARGRSNAGARKVCRDCCSAVPSVPQLTLSARRPLRITVYLWAKRIGKTMGFLLLEPFLGRTRILRLGKISPPCANLTWLDVL